MFMSFFFKKGKKKTSNVTIADDVLVLLDDKEEEVDQVVADEVDADDVALDNDDGHAMFNQEAFTSVRDKTIELMAGQGVIASVVEFQMAQEIMPRVCINPNFFAQF